jgi:hypothetical protein
MLETSQSFLAVSGFNDPVMIQSQYKANDLAHARIVVHEKNPSSATT